jgi:cholest-4-en-3-one 26-monooxygenase
MSAAPDLLDDFDIISPESFARHGYPHEEWKRLRAESPVHFYEDTPIPFWAITKHADITTISRQPELFLSNPRLFVSPLFDRADEETSDFERPTTLIEQDNPMHRKSRKLISNLFTPRALKRIHADVDRIAKQIVEDLLEQGDEVTVDFVDKVSAPLPIAVIGWLLGVPEPDWPKLYDWTNRMLGADDPEYSPTDENEGQRAVIELFTYFTHLVEARRQDPKEDLITVFANAEIDGKKLELMDVLGWCQIIVAAGNETTRNATSGGILAFAEHPDQLRRLQGDMSLLKPAVEEVVRWSSPIIHFARTAAADTEVRGTKIAKGDTVALYYPSANRDEDVFEDPYTFRIDRQPNRHIAFGVGEHFCAGAHVARLELEYAYKYLLPRIEEIEVAGPVDRLQSNLIGGIKRLPIRYKLKPA